MNSYHYSNSFLNKPSMLDFWKEGYIHDQKINSLNSMVLWIQMLQPINQSSEALAVSIQA